METVDAKLQVAGSCTHPEHIILRNRRLRSMCFPATFAVIRHPELGVILYDTGYSEHFLSATQKLPERIYRWVTPVTLSQGDTAAEQLRASSIDPESVAIILVSHFHADHVGGLRDFPRARFLFFESSWQAVRNLRGIGALRKGYLPALLPADFESRAKPIATNRLVALPPELTPFTHGFDIFGDSSIFAVELKGHAAGQMGIVLRLPSGAFWFLVADACWTSACYQNRIPPHPVTRLLFDNTSAYKATLSQLADLFERRQEVKIIPSHCSEVLADLRCD